MRYAYAAALCALLGAPAFALNVDYQVRVDTVWHFEGGCDDEPLQAQEYTAIVRAQDNTFSPPLSSSPCLTVDFDGNTSNDYGLVYRAAANSAATNILIGLLAFEDDCSDRCTFDSGCLFSVADDCLLDSLNLGAIAFRTNPPGTWTSYGPFGSGSHYVRVSVIWSNTALNGFTEIFSGGGDSNDLAFKTVTFTPDGSSTGYIACIQPAEQFITDPAGGANLGLVDDSYTEIITTNGQVLLYGVSYSNIFVGSNGYLTFGAGDGTFAESSTNHYNFPRISALFDDLNPSQAGTITWRDLPDRVAITYLGVTEHNAGNTNDVQVELLFDGRIRITWLRVDATDGLAGLSIGSGLPAAFAETDLSALAVCPTFSATPFAPAHANIDVSAGSSVLIDYSQTTLQASFSDASLKVWGKQTGFYPGAFDFPCSQCGDFNPSVNFRPGEDVVVMLNSGILSAGGLVLNPRQWQFTVAAEGCTNFTFYGNGQALGGDSSSSVALGDVDGDGDLDLLVCNNVNADPNRLYQNNGSGIFTNSGQALGTNATSAVALGDLDSDGDLDAVFGNDGSPSWVYFNNGAGIFTDSGQSIGNDQTMSIALGDLNGDGHLDLVTGNGAGSSRVYFNHGAGILADSGQALAAASFAGLALGDTESDGDLDLVLTHSSGPNRLYTNNGTGFFADSGQALGGTNRMPVLANVDGDLDLDLVLASSAGPDRVLLNNGSGIFSDSGQSLAVGGVYETTAASLGDVDGDGDLDLVSGKYNRQSRLYLNDGTGVFATNVPVMTVDPTYAVAMGDVDGDGDLDLVSGNGFFGAERVYRNISCLETGDSDGDGIPTPDEIAVGLNPANPADAAADTDTDGQSVLEEYIAGTLWNDGTSYFRLEAFTRDDIVLNNIVNVRSGRVYTIERRNAMGALPDWTPYQVYTSSFNIFYFQFGTTAIDSQQYYRAKVRLTPPP
jgi:hypothetical protein